MANFPEPTSPSFDPVRIIETNDPVLGGAAEISGVVNSPVNYALRELVERTQYLKQQVEGISIPTATRSRAGVAPLASLAEVNVGANDSKIVTPYLLQQKINDIPGVDPATTARRGIVELATNIETRTGTDTEKAVTPAGLKSVTDDLPAPTSVSNASTNQRGIVELATRAEGAARSRSDVAVTPDAMDAALDALPNVSHLLPAATPTITLSSNPGNIREQRNIVIGRMLFSRINIGGTVLTNFTWTIGGGAWRIMSASYYSSSSRRLVVRNTGGDGTGILSNISHNSNNTQFRLDNALASGDIFLITAILN